MPKNIREKKIEDEMEKRRLDEELDRQLEATFPGSDAPKITRKQSDLPSALRRRVGDKG